MGRRRPGRPEHLVDRQDGQRAHRRDRPQARLRGRGRDHGRDDLQTIKGVGPFIEEKLNALGITTFRQVANMTPELEDQVNTAIEFFPGRVRRDKWAKQADGLMRK